MRQIQELSWFLHVSRCRPPLVWLYTLAQASICDSNESLLKSISICRSEKMSSFQDNIQACFEQFSHQNLDMCVLNFQQWNAVQDSYLGTRVVLCRQWVLWGKLLRSFKNPSSLKMCKQIILTLQKTENYLGVRSQCSSGWALRVPTV